MAKYTGPKCRVARALGTTLDGLKSRQRDIGSKCNMTTKPGMHTTKKQKESGYASQLREQQKFKHMYGVLGRQFTNYYATAARQKGATGENLWKLLESRLDNLVYRMGFGSTRAEARQLVSHRSIMINGKIVNIPSCQVKAGDIIEIREKAKSQTRIQDALRLAENAGFPDWVEVDTKKLEGVYKRVPERNDLPAELNEQLVVELYAK